jgi:uroporphyrinogen-III synthase
MVAPEPATLANKRVLVTRSAHQAQRLCELIERAGGTPVRFPTIEIAPPGDRSALERIVDRLQEFDLAIFVSPNAVVRAMEIIRARRGGPPAQLTIACIGTGSARALAEAGVSGALIPARSDSEGLLQLAPLAQIAGRRVVIFRGQSGRELLAEALRQRGAQVEYAECYRRQRPATDPHPLAREFMQDRIDVVTTTSADALRNLYEMLGRIAGPRLARVPLVVVSERLRDLAHELGHHGPVEVAALPADDAVVAAAATLVARSETGNA